MNWKRIETRIADVCSVGSAIIALILLVEQAKAHFPAGWDCPVGYVACAMLNVGYRLGAK